MFTTIKRWMHAGLAALALAAGSAAAQAETQAAQEAEALESGAYLIVSVTVMEELAPDHFARLMLPEAEAATRHAWLRLDRDTGKAELHTIDTDTAVPYRLDFAKRALSAQGKSNGPHLTGRIEPVSSREFQVIQSDAFVLTLRKVEDDAPELAALEAAHRAKVEAKRAQLSRLLADDPDPQRPRARLLVDSPLPYVFEMPADWQSEAILADPREAFVTMLRLSTVGIPQNQNLTVGQLLTMSEDDFWDEVLERAGPELTLRLDAPERHLTVFIEEPFDDKGLAAIVRDDDGNASYWYLPSGAAEQDIRDAVAMLRSIRAPGGPSPSPPEAPEEWGSYRMEEEPARALREAMDEARTVNRFLMQGSSAFGSTNSVSMTDRHDRRLPMPLTLALSVDGKALPDYAKADKSPPSQPPALTRGLPQSGALRLWNDGACEAVLTRPVVAASGERLAELRISYNRPASHVALGVNEPGLNRQGHCIAAWTALHDFGATLDDTIVTAVTPALARQLAEHDSAHVTDDIYVTVSNPAEDRRGLLTLEGEVVLPTRYSRIEVRPSALVANDADGDWLFSREGRRLLDEPLQAILPVEGLDGHLMLRTKDAEEDSPLHAVLRVADTTRVLPMAFREIRYDKKRQVFLTTYPDSSNRLFSLQGEPIGDQHPSIRRLFGSAHYTVKTADGTWHVADARMKPISPSYASLWDHSRARLLAVTLLAEGGGRGQSAYVDYDGKRVTPEDMTPQYAPSDEGYITVWQERKPYFNRFGERRRYWGLIDRTGKVAIPLEHAQLHQARDGVVPVSDGDRFALFSVDGTALTEFKWANLTLSYSGGLMALDPASRTWQLIDHQGQPRHPDTFTGVADGLPKTHTVPHHESGKEVDAFAVYRDGKAGLISAQGEILVPFEFAEASPDWPEFIDAHGQRKSYPRDFKQP